MKTRYENWTIKDLIEKINKIEFPEFQREPTVWRLDKKQRLIDSILRDFNISSIYLYQREDEYYDCIDGQQRINTILSYTGSNTSDESDNKFHLKIENEIYSDKGQFSDVKDKRFENLPQRRKDQIFNYKLNIVIIEEVDNDEELNLQFLRLQIASILNAGEKLNAMTGEMRNKIFHNIVKFIFFKNLKIPERRFSKEQVAAQIFLNVFSLRQNDDFHRSRYIDLQEFFKQYNILNPEDKSLIKSVEVLLELINEKVGAGIQIIKNRALAVSLFLYIYLEFESNLEQIVDFFDFFKLLLKTLKWQIPKGVEIDREYLDLFNFQSNISQAAVERPAIQRRHYFLRKYYDYYIENHSIIGDKEYEENGNGNPDKERDKEEL